MKANSTENVSTDDKKFTTADIKKVVEELKEKGVLCYWDFQVYRRRCEAELGLTRGQQSKVAHYYEDLPKVENIHITSELIHAGYDTRDKVLCLIHHDKELKEREERLKQREYEIQKILYPENYGRRVYWVLNMGLIPQN